MYPKTLLEWALFLVRSSLLALWFFTISGLLFLIAIFRPFHHSNGTLFCRWLSPLALKILGIELEFRHPEKASRAQPCIFLGNHQHLIDVYTFSYTLSERTITLGKKSIRFIPFFGWLYWLSGQVLIDRGNNEKAVATLDRAMNTIREKQLSLFIFPEGTRSRGRPFGPFKKGAFHMAVRSGLPLVPVVASDYFRHLKLGRWRAGKVIMEALDPIQVDGRTAEELLKLSRERMVVAMEQINGELTRLR